MIFLITGPYGGGKTMFMVRMAVLTRLAHKAAILEEEHDLVAGTLSRAATKTQHPRLMDYATWLENYQTEREEDVIKIVSNFVLYGVRYLLFPTPLAFFQLLESEKVEPRVFKNCLFLLDEAHTYVDARRSGSKLNINYDHFFDEVRKRNIDLYATTQQWEKVDMRLRAGVNWHIQCKCDKERAIVYFKGSNPITGAEKRKFIGFSTPELWPFYNTNELVQKTGKNFTFKLGDL